jgi:hypothetical protein
LAQWIVTSEHDCHIWLDSADSIQPSYHPRGQFPKTNRHVDDVQRLQEPCKQHTPVD